MPAFTIELPNGKRMDVEADDENAAISGAQNWFKQNVTDKTDTSALGALSEGTSGVATGFGKTIKHYINGDAGNAVLDSAIAKANPKYKSASEGFMRPEDGEDNHVMGLDWSKAPRALLEQLPGLAADLAVQRLVPKALGPVGKYAANALTFGGRTAGAEAEHRAAERTGDANAEPNLEDKLIGLKSTAEQAALNQVGLNKIISPAKVLGTGMKGVSQAAGNVVKGAAAEGLTSAGQNVISQAEAKQTIDPSQIDGHEAIGQGVLGGMGGGIFSVPKAGKEASAAVKLRDTEPDVHAQMAANRILDYVSKPKDLEDRKTAFKATDAASSAVQSELADVAKTVTNAHPDTASALDRARSGEVLSPKELERIDSLGNDRLSNLSRQSNEFAKLKERGNYDESDGSFAGGMGEFARQHGKGALLSLGGAGAAAHAIGHGAAGLDTLVSGLPGAAEGIAAALAGYKGLKVIDRMTGNSSPARAYAEKFGNGGAVRPDVALNQSPTGPKVEQQNSVTTPQPWGPVQAPPQRFKPDIVEPGISKIVEKIQRQKQQQTAREAMPLLRQLAEQNQPAPAAPGPDVNAMNEQVKSALLMASARRKIAGQQQAEAEAADSHAINEAGGLDTLRNPAFGKRGSELLQAANVMNRLRAVPEAPDAPPTAPAPPEAPQPPYHSPGPQGPSSMADILQRLNTPQPEAPQPQPQPQPEAPKAPFVLPESPHVFKEPKEASHAILQEAIAGGKEIRNAEGYRASTQRRLTGEEAIYNTISKELNTVQERGDFHKYLSALWGSDSPEIVTQVREHMLSEFPHHAATINKHLSDEKIKGLWTKPKKAKK